jgi:threonine/homoserine/homoserine lactone efflux protein
VGLIEILIKGVVLGFVSSIPLGPIGIICVQRTLGKGRLSGFVSGLGAASADTFLAIVAGLGLSFIIEFIRGNSVILTFFGGIIVVIIGIQIFFKSPVRQVRERRMKKNNLYTDYLSVLALTLSNPLAVFLFIAVFAGLNLVNGYHNFFLQTLIFSGIFLGASLWWFILSSFVNLYRDKFRLKNLWWLNKITGAVIFIFGVVALLSILFSQIKSIR